MSVTVTTTKKTLHTAKKVLMILKNAYNSSARQVSKVAYKTNSLEVDKEFSNLKKVAHA